MSDFLAETVSSPAGIALFICIAAVFAVIQYFIFSYVRKLRKESATRALHLGLTYKVVTIAQYVLLAIIAFIILQILGLSHTILSFYTRFYSLAMEFGS